MHSELKQNVFLQASFKPPLFGSLVLNFSLKAMFFDKHPEKILTTNDTYFYCSTLRRGLKMADQNTLVYTALV